MYCVDYIMRTIEGFKSTHLETAAQRKEKLMNLFYTLH